ncbi:MAG TPA: hypothetical protein VGL57_00870 [Solirubrobacteraceae bacterium]
MRIRLALAAGLLLIALAAARTLAHAPLVVTLDNSLVTHETLVSTTAPATACQAGEILPAGTSAIRLGLTTALGPRVRVTVWSGSRLLTEGVHGPGWEGASVTVPVRPVASRTLAPVRVCLRLDLLNGPVSMLGWDTRHAIAATGGGKRLPGRMHIEYLRPAQASWLSMASATARRLGFGRAASGIWNAVLVGALAALLVAISCWLVTRELQ